MADAFANRDGSALKDHIMRCENCNTENAADAEYCAGCGERLLYDEDFFKLENNVDALPKLEGEQKPIRAFKTDRWQTAVARRIFKAMGGDEPVRETEETRKRANTETILALCFVAILAAALFVTRVLR
jgi:hypothetical protein